MPRDSKGSPPRRSADLSFRREDPAPRKQGSLFGWTIAILLLIGFASSCWIFSIYVFGHPEKPLSYQILTKLKKLETPRRFEITQGPVGEFLSTQELWDRYNAMSNRELERTSEILLRNYLRNYKLTRDRVPYITGTYTILDSYELTDKNLFPSGVVAICQAKEAPQVLLEHVFTADARVIPMLHRMLLTGLDLRFDKTLDLSALLNVRRLADGRLQFTAIPLLYGSYATNTGPGTFSLEPPTGLNMKAGLPVVNTGSVTDAGEKLASFRQRAGLDQTGPKLGAQRPQMQLVRVERPQPASSSAEAAHATPPAAATPTPLPEDAPVRQAIPVDGRPVPAVASATPPAPAATATPATEVPLQPFVSPTPASIATTAGGNWPTYPAGQMPRGRLASVPDVSELAGRGVGGERVYLQGSFVVTASGQNRAVLRSQAALPENLGIGGGRTGNTRIIVEFPAGSRPPSEGSTFSRDARRPFLVTDVRKTADGQVNVYVREVTRGAP